MAGVSGFSRVMRVSEFRAVLAAEVVSVVGDQLARVALAWLVYGRTSSATLSALTYAATFVPSVLGGALLSGLADRFPRRRVLVVADVVRAVLALGMAVPGLGLWALVVLVAVTSVVSAPFKAAQLALLPQLVASEAYRSAVALRQMCAQVAQVTGFAGGGLLLAAVDARVVLVVNAATFAVSAAVILLGVSARPAARERSGESERGAVSGWTPRVVAVAAVMVLVGLFVVPEGLAAPYGAAVGAGAWGVGLLMAADPVGSVVGAWLGGRSSAESTGGLAAGLAAASGVPLVVCVWGPGLWVSAALWAVSGALSTASLVHAQAVIVELVPDERRGRVMGVVATCLYASQGVAILAGGVVADVAGPVRAVAAAGLVGSAAAVVLWWWLRGRPGVDGQVAEDARQRQMSLFDMSGRTSSQAHTAEVTP